MRDTLYIIDGHSQIYRAYYAPFRDLTSPAGEPTRATYVFCSMLMKFVADRRPRYLVMAVDGPTAKLHRTAIYPRYKETRSPMPDDLPPQVDRIMRIVRAMEVPILQIEGQEADDIIASLAERHKAAMDVVIISRDKDLDQLVGPGVVMYDPMKDETFDALKLLEAKGYPPEKAVEVQTLMGDSIDNIPGIPGVGPKTAAKLIMKYGTADAVLAHADEQTPKLRENLLKFAGNLAVARRLVTLERNIPIDLDLARMEFKGVATPAVREMFAELGFNRLIDQLGSATMTTQPIATAPAASGVTAPAKLASAPPARKLPAPPMPGGLFAGMSGGMFDDKTSSEQPVADTEQSRPDSTAGGIPPAVAPIPQPPAAPEGQTTAADFDYQLIDTIEQLEELTRQLKGVTRLAIDTETTGTQALWCKLVGISLAWAPPKAYYLPVRGPMGAKVLDTADIRRVLGPILADEQVEKIGQNVKFDMLVLGAASLPMRGRFFDTMVAAHVLDSTRMSYGLGALATEFLNHHGIPIEDLIGRGKKQITMDAVPTQTVAVYAAEDADLTLRLADLFGAQMKAEGLLGLFENLEMPLLPVLTEMERTGIIVDPAALKRMEVELSRQADVLRDKIIAAAGRPFNVNSPKQLATILFEELKLPVGRRTQTGPSTDSDVLEQLAVAHDLPGLVLDYRKLTKLIGTYLTALAECIHPQTGRVHTSFHQVGAATGRLSSSDPNLQNIPIRSEEGRRIRSAFVADDGCVLLSADYSQVELRVLAHMCQDPTLMAAFEADQDIHRIVAAEVFGVPAGEVTPEMRAKAKTVNFGIIYGQTAFGLALTLRISRGEAREFIDKYRRRFPQIEDFLQACVSQAKANGYVETIFGRRRRIPEIGAANPQRRALAERLAINSVVQGSAADLIKQAMVNIARRVATEGRPAKMLLQIHDELVFEMPEAAVDSEREMIVYEMSSAIKLRVPLKVDTGVGKNWMEAK